jgi:hypothetical protein
MFNYKRTFCSTVIVSVWLLACTGEDAAKSGELEITLSAEGLGANGYSFPPTSGQEVAFVDGWAVDFERIIVAVDNLRVSEMPDKDPGDQSVVGKEIALRKGPFVVDLKGRGNAVDKGGAGRVAIRLPVEDLEGLFNLEQRYAFSYDLVAPTSKSTFVNVEADDSDVLAMIESGQRAFLTGIASFKGKDCSSSVPDYDFDALAKQVNFRLGLSGSVAYVNCQNPDNTGSPIDGEESPRGVQLLPNQPTVAQITIHTDHLFWPTISHENLPMFNQFAANARLKEGTWSVELNDVKDVPVSRITDSAGRALPWRTCVDSSLFELPASPLTVSFDTASENLNNLSDFVQFNGMTMGHLNADGLCYVSPKQRD